MDLINVDYKLFNVSKSGLKSGEVVEGRFIFTILNFTYITDHIMELLNLSLDFIDDKDIILFNCTSGNINSIIECFDFDQVSHPLVCFINIYRPGGNNSPDGGERQAA